jgi:hypothetical protein
LSARRFWRTHRRSRSHAPPGEPGNIPGLYDLRGNYISRADAELWVERETRTAKRRQSWCFYALLFLTSVAAIASVVAAVKAGVVHR